MAKLTKSYRKNPEIRARALGLVQGQKEKDWRAEVSAVFVFVRDSIRYVRDTRDVETLQTPTATLAIGQGDCDDQSTLLAALLESIGHPTRFIAVGLTPGKFQHVMVQTRIGPRWINLDPTEQQPAGWEPPGIAARMLEHV